MLLFLHPTAILPSPSPQVGRKVTVGGIRSFKPEKASCASASAGFLKHQPVFPIGSMGRTVYLPTFKVHLSKKGEDFSTAGSWFFQHFLEFSARKFGEDDPILTHIFTDGLVQPPTRTVFG